jgi:hypothetical protein
MSNLSLLQIVALGIGGVCLVVGGYVWLVIHLARKALEFYDNDAR